MVATKESWQPARLFPVTGIGGADEQERRATSALLAVLKAVQEFGRTLTMRLGAPAGSSIETFIELPLEYDGKPCRPDGLIRVVRGKREWTVLVEVKTGHNRLQADQISTYLDVARQMELDGVLTISHEIPTTPGVHPVAVDGRKLRRVQLHHLSWGQIHTEALIEQFNQSVADPDQAWILSEFIRYLEDPKSGALDFDDMGASWVTVRDNCARQTLRASDPETLDVVARFDQLISFAGMSLSRRLGVHVRPVLTAKELADQSARLQGQAALVARTGQLKGSLHVPNAAAPVDVLVDLRANRIDCSVTVTAPREGRASTRLNWLLRQMNGAPAGVRVQLHAARIRDGGTSFSLEQIRENPKRALPASNVEVRAFTITLTQPAGTKRGQGKGSFVGSLLTLVDRFYEEVVQALRPWNPSAPRVKPNETEVPGDLVIDGEHAAVADSLTGTSEPSVVAEIVSDQGSGLEASIHLDDEFVTSDAEPSASLSQLD
jgi:hypothetical protein